jgi:hypothetical protein
VHLNNARPNNSNKYQEYLAATRAQKSPHLADCSDLVFRDFFLFGHLKEKLEEIVFEIERT